MYVCPNNHRKLNKLVQAYPFNIIPEVNIRWFYATQWSASSLDQRRQYNCCFGHSPLWVDYHPMCCWHGLLWRKGTRRQPPVGLVGCSWWHMNESMPNGSRTSDHCTSSLPLNRQHLQHALSRILFPSTTSVLALSPLPHCSIAPENAPVPLQCNLDHSGSTNHPEHHPTHAEQPPRQSLQWSMQANSTPLDSKGHLWLRAAHKRISDTTAFQLELDRCLMPMLVVCHLPAPTKGMIGIRLTFEYFVHSSDAPNSPAPQCVFDYTPEWDPIIIRDDNIWHLSRNPSP